MRALSAPSLLHSSRTATRRTLALPLQRLLLSTSSPSTPSPSPIALFRAQHLQQTPLITTALSSRPTCATMSTQSTQSEACCNTPAVVSKGYEPKGSYITVDGLKTYATGPSSAKRGILVVYDIFGFFPQTIQGADILSSAPAQVFMPDFFEGSPADISWYPPDTKEKGEKLGAFFQSQAAPPKTLSRIPKILDALQQSHGVQEWAIVGFCWGGKIVNLSSGKDTRFKVAAACHPAMVAAEDAENVTIPYAMLPSKDESKEDVEKWEKNIKTEHLVEWFPTQVHGWMAARSDLEKDEVRKEYERGYKTVLDFFAKHW